MPSKATVIASRSTHPCVIPALPFCDAELRAPKPKSEHYPKQINTLGDNICKHRLDLNLRQKQVADQIHPNVKVFKKRAGTISSLIGWTKLLR